MRQKTIQAKFIELAPAELEDGILYISEKYKAAIHKCCCGCGEKVITQLSPAHWRYSISRGEVSLHPSIGNWDMACQSHYWIKGNKVIWAGAMSQREIVAVKRRDRRDRTAQMAKVNHIKSCVVAPETWWHRLRRKLFE